PPEAVCLADYENLARERISEASWAWLQGGAADELSLRDNQAAFQRLRLAPRVPTDLAGGHTRLNLLGQAFEHPIFVAPVSYQGLAHPEGETATVLAASALQAGMVVSTYAGVPLETLAQQARAPLWFQLYVQHDREFTLALARRAEAAGYGALVLTVDAPVSGARNRAQRAGFVLPEGLSAVNLHGARTLAPHTAPLGSPPLFGSPLLETALSWRDIAWLREQT